MQTGERFLILGGGGMIGQQVVGEIARDLKPQSVIIWSLYQREVRQALDDYKREFPHVSFIGFWGDMFLRAEWNPQHHQKQKSRAQLLASSEIRAELYEDLFGDFDAAYEKSHLAQLILEHKPDVVVDAVNTATGISYQDIYQAADETKKRFDALAQVFRGKESKEEEELEILERTELAVEKLLISQSVPQLIRHVLLIHRAMTEAGTRLYLKVGTTGTGGMGLNIPYTHSEDKPSAKLMTKTAIAFAHTGLMFLMARTPGGPVVKEIKPGAMVGYANITRKKIKERGNPVYVFESREERLAGELILKQSEHDYEKVGPLEVVVADTGENGLFTKGEFEAITNLWQMEFITPEEIAQQVALEIKGSNTGLDVIAAIDSAVMNPTYRAGYLRQFALDEITRLEERIAERERSDGAKEKTKITPSVSLGQLGPPELGKLLWEAHLLKLRYETLTGVLEEESAEAISQKLFNLVQSDEVVRQTIVSVGLPILTPDGKSLIRGPVIRIPEIPNVNKVNLTKENVDKWARKGWVDLRCANMERWRERFKTMLRETNRIRGRGSAAVTREAYLTEEISIGAVVGWIFNNEEGGYRIK